MRHARRKQIGLDWRVKVEQQSKVKIPPNLAEQTLIRLMRAGDRLWRDSDERFGRWRLTDNHYNVLRILNGAGEPISQIEIGRRMLSSRANVTKLIDWLEELGYVKRLSCGDRRVKLIELTPEGAAFLAETIDDVIAYAERALSVFEPGELQSLSSLLAKIVR